MESKSLAVAAPGPTSSYPKYGNLPDVDTSAPDLYESGQLVDTQHSSTSRRKHRQLADDDEAKDSSDFTDDSDDPVSSSRKHQGHSGAKPSNNDIDSNSVSRTMAAAKFGRATDLDATRIDFSGRVRTMRGRNAADNSKRSKDAGFETDLYALDNRSQGSALDRLRQLKYEANLLEEELASQASIETEASLSKQGPGISPHVLIAQLQVLQARLAELDPRASVPVNLDVENSSQNLNSLVQHLSQNSSAQITSTAVKAPEVKSSPENSDVALLDARLAEIESVLGLHQSIVEEADAAPRPLLSTLSRLESQLALLSQPRHLDTISRRVKVLVTEMDRMYNVRKELNTGVTDRGPASSDNAKSSLTPSDFAQLEQLFKVTKRLEPLLPIVLPVLNRLQTLSDLHASASHFESTLLELQARVETQHQQTAETNQLLVSMEANMLHNRTTMQTNLESLQKRISDVVTTLQPPQ